MKNLLFFDLETTGTDVAVDKIIQFGAILPNGAVINQLFNPDISIPAEATAIHHISDEMVANEPSFSSLAKDIFDMFMDAEAICGFNILRFDLPLIAEELARCGYTLPTTIKVIDAQVIFHTMEPRTLAAAYKFYCDKEHSESHDALADTKATAEVLTSQLNKYAQLSNNIDELHKLSTRDCAIVDWGGKFGRDADGDIILLFGKYKGRKAKVCLSYLDWMISKGDFPESTLNVCREVLSEAGGDDVFFA